MAHTRVLLAESNTLVAMDVATELEMAGIAIAGVAASVGQALKLVENRQVDFALLNVGLRDGASFPLAKRLMAMDIPFAFLTSFEKNDIAPEFRNIPCISKPQYTQDIANSVCKLLERPIGAVRSAATPCPGQAKNPPH